jgi:hypothetical protein
MTAAASAMSISISEEAACRLMSSWAIRSDSFTNDCGCDGMSMSSLRSSGLTGMERAAKGVEAAC